MTTNNDILKQVIRKITIATRENEMHWIKVTPEKPILGFAVNGYVSANDNLVFCLELNNDGGILSFMVDYLNEMAEFVLSDNPDHQDKSICRMLNVLHAAIFDSVFDESEDINDKLAKYVWRN